MQRSQRDTRTRIVQAAARIMREKGISRTTTKEIARRAGTSEGNLYNHFGSKHEIFIAVLREQAPAFIPLLIRLIRDPGAASLRDNLEQITSAAIDFYHEVTPMGASFFSEKKLLESHRRFLKERGVGPQKAGELLAAYLQSEQRRGRVRHGAETRLIADMLLGTCFQHAYWAEFLDLKDAPESRREYAARIVDLLLPQLLPVQPGSTNMPS